MMEPPEESAIWVSGSPGAGVGHAGRKVPGDKMRILVVNDHAGYRQELRSILERESDIEVVGEAGNGGEALELAAALKPDLVLMGINAPGMAGIETTRKLTANHPGIHVLILTMFKEREHLRAARRAGASAYVMKDAGPGLLLETIRSIMEGEHPLLQRSDQTTDVLMAERLPPDRPPVKPISVGTDYLITSNERSILKALAQGLANDQIAERLGVPESMVRTYLSEIYRKLGLSGRDAAAQYAREHRIAE
jgi:DNA-binding NarL/FixJ family response regulator